MNNHPEKKRPGDARGKEEKTNKDMTTEGQETTWSTKREQTRLTCPASRCDYNHSTDLDSYLGALLYVCEFEFL